MSTEACQRVIADTVQAYYAANPGTLEAERKQLLCAGCDGTKPKHWKRHGIGKRGGTTVRLFERDLGSRYLPGQVVITEEKADGTVSMRWAQSVEQAVLETGISWNWNGLGSMTTKDALLNPKPELPAPPLAPSPWVLITVPYHSST